MNLYPNKTVEEIARRAYGRRVKPALKRVMKYDRRLGSPLAKRMFKLAENFFALGYVPGLRDRVPYFDPKKTNLSWLPINKEIEGAGGLALSEEVLDRLIEKSRHRVILNFCGCRRGYKCEHYPVEMGCLFMGESAMEISRKICREASVEEAKAHARKAFDMGLVPITGKARIDNDILGVPDRGKLLTTCFCCECCCVTRFTGRGPVDLLGSLHHPVEGLSIEVTEECVGCGECIEKCYIDAIDLKGGRAIIGDYCRVCGRCAAVCPNDAIKLRLDNPGAVEDVVRRIEGVVEF